MQGNPRPPIIVIKINYGTTLQLAVGRGADLQHNSSMGWLPTASVPPLERFTPGEQRTREKAYDQGLRSVEREARRLPRTKAERTLACRRIVDAFPSFAAVALGLAPEAVDLLTGTFLPAGTELARWARSFDKELTVSDTVQACLNAWTACGLQALLGQPMQLTSALAVEQHALSLQR